MKQMARLLDLEGEDIQSIFSHHDGIGSSPSIFLALRQALFYEVGAGTSPPTVWIHNSFGPNGIVTIGSSEKPTRVDMEACRELGVPVYVRTSGGWHIYNDESFLFVNVFLPRAGAQRAGIANTKDGLLDQTSAFRLNSGLMIETLRLAGVRAYLHPTDPSSILADNNLIAINSARISEDGTKAIYMEGGLRHSDRDLERAARTLVLTKEERDDLLQRNTSIGRFSPDVSIKDLKAAAIGVYTSSGGFENYRWERKPLSEREIELAAGYAKNYRSLTELSKHELQQIGIKEGRVCVVHWITEKYGSYTPGA